MDRKALVEFRDAAGKVVAEGGWGSPTDSLTPRCRSAPRPSNIPPDVCNRFETADKLSDEDRKAILDIARAALVPFQPVAEQKT